MTTPCIQIVPSDDELRTVFHELGQLFTAIIQVIEHVEEEKPPNDMIRRIAKELNGRTQGMIPKFQNVAYRLR